MRKSEQKLKCYHLNLKKLYNVSLSRIWELHKKGQIKNTILLTNRITILTRHMKGCDFETVK